MFVLNCPVFLPHNLSRTLSLSLCERGFSFPNPTHTQELPLLTLKVMFCLLFLLYDRIYPQIVQCGTCLKTLLWNPSFYGTNSAVCDHVSPLPFYFRFLALKMCAWIVRRPHLSHLTKHTILIHWRSINKRGHSAGAIQTGGESGGSMSNNLHSSVLFPKVCCSTSLLMYEKAFSACKFH